MTQRIDTSRALLDEVDYETFWGPFDEKFRFRPNFEGESFGIDEPTPSITFDLSPIFNGDPETFYDLSCLVETTMLGAFQQICDPTASLYRLSWQHPTYRYQPHELELTESKMVEGEYEELYFPNGDYFVSVDEQLTMGCFGHPWRQTFCVFGDRLVERVGDVWPIACGPIKRIDGIPQ